MAEHTVPFVIRNMRVRIPLLSMTNLLVLSVTPPVVSPPNTFTCHLPLLLHDLVSLSRLLIDTFTVRVTPHMTSVPGLPTPLSKTRDMRVLDTLDVSYILVRPTLSLLRQLPNVCDSRTPSFLYSKIT